MASHPYRQKAATVPYPVHSHDGAAEPSRVPGAPLGTSSPNRLPYPASPPPIFPTTSAHSQPSAASSLTNLDPHGAERPALTPQRMAASDANLAGTHLVSPTPKWGHNRLVSSTLSYFYDRENYSVADLDNSMLQQYLGSHSSSLVPRFKTIELYRQNAKKTNDPTVLFQYAQYMLQTALMMESSGPLTPGNTSDRRRLRTLSMDLAALANTSFGSGGSGGSGGASEGVDDAKMRAAILREAHVYLKKLADKAYADAQYLLGDAYSSGAFGRVENKEAFSLFQAAAKRGHVESAYRTSHCYEEGLGTGRDARKAVDYLKMAASRNHTAAMYKLGVYMFHGRMGVGQDVSTKKMGIKWLERAAAAATELTAAAPYELGNVQLEGFKDIVIADRKYAMELYSQAAALGHVRLAALLGHFYEVGDTVPQDANLSIHYYTQGALGGDPGSMVAMGAWYLVGHEPHLPKDEGEAFEWMKRAASMGHPRAELAMANFYEKGIGCSKNDAEAQSWYVRAAEHGESKAVDKIHDKQVAAKLQKKLKKLAAAQEKDCCVM